jgi:zinc/manganese transport system ATP-binding protein
MTPLRTAPEIALTNLTVAYDGHPAVHHLSGAFASGSLTAIVGPNGAGKSTLLSALSGQLKGIEGSIRFGDAARIDLAYLPQQSAIDREFPVRVLDVVVRNGVEIFPRHLGGGQTWRPLVAGYQRRL